MNLSHLHYFKKLAEVKHYSKAAKELFISQPTLSSAISSLENELDVALFERDGRSIKLTSSGEIFYNHVRAALRELDDGIQALNNQKLAICGTVKLGAIFTVQDDYLPRLLKDFFKEYKNSILVQTYQNFTNALTAQLRDGSIDVAFCGKRADATDIDYYPVEAYDLKFCVHKDHPLAHRDRVSLNETRDYTVYSYAMGTPIGDQIASLIKEHHMDNVIQLYQEDVAMGSFIAYSDNRMDGALMLDSIGLKLFPDLVAIPVDEVPTHFYQVYLSYYDNIRSRVVDQFIEFTKAYAVGESGEATVPDES